MEEGKKIVPVMSVKKALDLLEMLLFQDVKRNGIRLSDMAAKLNVPDNTARNLLKTMIECGFVAQNQEARYIAGKKCQQIGAINKYTSASVNNAINRALDKFIEKIDETVTFAILSDGYRDIIAEASSQKTVKVVYEKTSSVNIYSVVTGRVLAAYADKDELAQIIRRYGMPGEHWNNIKNMNSLEKELQAIRKKGYCILSAKNSETMTFACPVLDKDDKLIGSVGSYAPIFRCPQKKHGEVIQALKEAAVELSKSTTLF
ncbi:MAG: hypothetical protein A2017_02885 [Lentisphaerae bacterium GWF2_44_16]|nr:MAG: hypothetical protein A2017_02885 [Lentisphaerae bacterium GWF2_44_16]